MDVDGMEMGVMKTDGEEEDGFGVVGMRETVMATGDMSAYRISPPYLLWNLSQVSGLY